ncbi:pyruvate kinase, partial [uncultured Bilophila sp.]
LLDDGLVRLTVLETTASAIRCRVENDGVMKNNKGVNIPNVRLSMPYMNQRDREDMEKAGAGRGIRQFGGQKTMYCG